jgi:dihydropteroate synthase
MGILNVTPDSFSDGGRYNSLDKAFYHVESMLQAGASLIDVGGESTRPGAAPVSLQQELDRVIPIIEALNQRFDPVISLDSSCPEVMLEASKRGIGLINDVRALQRPGALAMVARLEVPVCLMHMQGTPQTMQSNPSYVDVVAQVKTFLLERIASCQQAGIRTESIIIDPGFGFGKTLEQNCQLLRQLDALARLGYPVLVGLSRKSMIGAVLDLEINQRLAGSLALAVLAVSQGACIIRAHDVGPTVEAVKMAQAVLHE